MAVGITSRFEEDHFGKPSSPCKNEKPIQIATETIEKTNQGRQARAPATPVKQAHSKQRLYNPCKTNTPTMDGEITYVEDLPMIILHTHDPRKAGRTLGYLTAQHAFCFIQKLSDRLGYLLMQTGVTQALEQIKKNLPASYIAEMEGYIEGYTERCRENGISTKLTLDMLLLLQIQPEIGRLQDIFFKQQSAQLNGTPGCSVVVSTDAKSGMVMGRNLDWDNAQIQKLGSFSFLLKRHLPDGRVTSSIGFPCLLGDLTGMNSDGLCIAMCVINTMADCEVEAITGMPSGFLNRYVLENFKTAGEAKQYLQEAEALCPYHLTVADAETAHCCHLHQGKEGAHYFRTLEPEGHLVTANPFFKDGQMQESLVGETERRHESIDSVMRSKLQGNRKKKRLVKDSLEHPNVNKSNTLQSCVLYPQEKRMKLSIADAMAAGVQRIDLSEKQLFG